ncbi:MAG: sulfatase [Pacificimonas sp.]
MRLFAPIFLMIFALFPAAATDRPNIIVILADDLGWGDIGVNGAELIETPRLDRMAAEGARLTSFYASANVCTPARAALMTGRYAIRSGLADQVIQPWSTHGLPASEITLPELLKSNGYRTALLGKWHLGHQPEHHPLEHGFDRFFGIPYSNDMNPLALYEGREAVEQPVEQATLTRRLTQAAIDIVQNDTDEPFFIYLAHPMPHIPLHASEAFRGRSAAGLYGDVVEELDHEVGRLIDEVVASGKANDTVIVFTSDNGPWFEGSSGPFRGRKGSSWEGGYRVPFITYAPGRIAPGTESGAPAGLIDLLPTFAELGGATVPGDRPIDGRDIWPVLTAGADSPHEAIWFFDNDQITALPVGNERLVFQDYYRGFDLPLDQFGSFLLFDLEQDPTESYSLSRARKERVAELRERLEAARAAFDVPVRPPFRLPVPEPDNGER